MLQKRGGTSSTRGTAIDGEAAKNNGNPVKGHTSQPRQLAHPGDAICFPGREGGRAGRERARARKKRDRVGGGGLEGGDEKKTLSLFGFPEMDPEVRLGWW